MGGGILSIYLGFRVRFPSGANQNHRLILVFPILTLYNYTNNDLFNFKLKT